MSLSTWLPCVLARPAHPCTLHTAVAFPAVPAGRMGTTGSSVGAWAGSSVMPWSLQGWMGSTWMCSQAMLCNGPQHREPSMELQCCKGRAGLAGPVPVSPAQRVLGEGAWQGQCRTTCPIPAGSRGLVRDSPRISARWSGDSRENSCCGAAQPRGARCKQPSCNAGAGQAAALSAPAAPAATD